MLTKSNSNQRQDGSPIEPHQQNLNLNHHHHHHHHLQQQQQGQQQQQQQQQQSQDALANLFRSLSNLANGAAAAPTTTTTTTSTTANQILLHQLSNCSPSSSINFNLAETTSNLKQLNEMNPTTSASTAIHHPTSFESVVAAAAAMQQHLVTAALNQQQQVSFPQNPPHEPQPPPPPSSSIIDNYLTSSQPAAAAAAAAASSKVPFLGDPMAGYPFLNNQSNPLVGPSDQELQYTMNDLSGRQQQQQQQQQQQNRINYCTICNKELCNKYFMKTHMLKMHGINLEMEQSGGEDETGQLSSGDNDGQHGQSAEGSSNSSPWSTKQGRRQDSAINSKQSSSSSHAQQPTGTNKPKGTDAPATSVMNGFAGNSMGGVVCDICNKELCSKYFLKVHKQNTHGITTDYQDANQFVYPFSNTLQNPFIAPQLQMSLPTSNMLSNPFQTNASCFNQNSGPAAADERSPTESRSKSSGAKKSRLMTNMKQQSKTPVEGCNPPSLDNQRLDSIYRLMMNQQQQQSCGVIGQTMFQAPTFDMSALMCFGAMGPFGPASISPTMIVEMILRNQHLINRNNKSCNQPGTMTTNQPSTTTGKLGKDKNNNDPKQGKQPGSSGKSAKETATANNNSRYFTHYTEACPMCDRRFKSIKWLKTHMMNDHKQEIGAYMQMMMQNMYASKSQQAAAPMMGGPSFDQISSYLPISSAPCYLPGSQQPQQQLLSLQPQSQSQPQLQPQSHHQNPPVTYNATQSKATNMAIRREQCDIVQSYLNQQGQIIQQQQHQQQHHHHQSKTQEMLNFVNTESSHSDQLTKLLTLTEAHHHNHHHGPETSSSSSDKTSPRSATTNFECDDDNQQLDLSMKFDLQPRMREDEVEIANYSQSRKRSVSEMIDDDYLDDDEDEEEEEEEHDDDDDSTRSSCNRDLDGQPNSATKSMKTNDLSLIQVNTSTDA